MVDNVQLLFYKNMAANVCDNNMFILSSLSRSYMASSNRSHCLPMGYQVCQNTYKCYTCRYVYDIDLSKHISHLIHSSHRVTGHYEP